MVAAQPKAQQSTEFSRNVFGMLARLRIEPTPLHFEMIHDMMSGNNPELRKQFLALGTNITPAAIDRLARKFLPHHFGAAVADKTAQAIRTEISDFRLLMDGNQSHLTLFHNTLSHAAERLNHARYADVSILRQEIAHVAHAASEQSARNSAALEIAGRQLAKVDSIQQELDEHERSKFVHGASGLGNRRAFNRTMADIFRIEGRPKDVTLVLGRIANFGGFNAQQMLKAKEMLLASFGSYVIGCLTPADTGYWIDEPEMAFVIQSMREDEVRDVTDRLRQFILVQFKALGLNSISVEKLHVCFGAANTMAAAQPAELIGHAERALNQALATGENRTMFHVMADKTRQVAGEGRDFALYGRKEFKM